MSANEALLIIDYTNDFVATDGALTCGYPGQKKLLEKLFGWQTKC